MAGQGVTELVVASHCIRTVALIVHELRDLDLGYASPFSPPYAPVLIAADELQKRGEGGSESLAAHACTKRLSFRPLAYTS